MFDPKGKEYQVTERYIPDKESTWKFPPTCDGWFHTDNALRGEVSSIRSALEAIIKRDCTTLQKWEVDSIQACATIHFDHMRSNDKLQEVVFIPEYNKRFRFPDYFDAGDKAVLERATIAECCIMKLKEGDNLDEVFQVWEEYEGILLPHLFELEESGIALMRAYFTQKDLAHLTLKLTSLSSKLDLGSFFYYMGEARLRNEFMKQEGIPWFVWHLDLKYKIKYFEKKFVKHIDALTSGIAA